MTKDIDLDALQALAEIRKSNKQYITANPQTILSLIARIRELEGDTGKSAEAENAAVLPNGAAVTNVYDAYRVGLEQAASICESLHATISDPCIIGSERAEGGHNTLDACAKAIRSAGRAAPEGGKP